MQTKKQPFKLSHLKNLEREFKIMINKKKKNVVFWIVDIQLPLIEFFYLKLTQFDFETLKKCYQNKKNK